MGGTWRAMRYLMATQEAAYSDYREATTETVLDFKGRWRTSRQPVEGEAQILEAAKTKFLIAFQGDVWLYGESGDILPDRSRVKATGQPLRVDTLVVEKQTYAQVLADVPAAAFVSGQLESERPFVPRLQGELSPGLHTAVTVAPNALAFEYAPRKRVELLDPVHRPDPAQREQLQLQLDAGQQELASLQLQRPPVHYLRLREAEEQQAVLQQKWTDLQDSTVVFSGKLLLRLPGRSKP